MCNSQGLAGLPAAVWPALPPPGVAGESVSGTSTQRAEKEVSGPFTTACQGVTITQNRREAPRRGRRAGPLASLLPPLHAILYHSTDRDFYTLFKREHQIQSFPLQGERQYSPHVCVPSTRPSNVQKRTSKHGKH